MNDIQIDRDSLKENIFKYVKKHSGSQDLWEIYEAVISLTLLYLKEKGYLNLK
jgi:hypothetical protein